MLTETGPKVQYVGGSTYSDPSAYGHGGEYGNRYYNMGMNQALTGNTTPTIADWLGAQSRADTNNVFRNLKTGAIDAGLAYSWGDQQLGFLDQNLPLDLADIDQAIKDNSEVLGYRDQILANLNSLYGINDRDLANQIAQSWLQQQTEESILGTNRQQNELEALQKGQTLFSQGVSGGSSFFPGQGIGQQQIRTAADQTNAIIDQRLRRATEGGELERTGLNIGAEKTKVGLGNEILNQRIARANVANQDKALANKKTRTNLAYQEKKAGIQNDQLGVIQKLRDLFNSGDPRLRELATNLAKPLNIEGLLQGG